MIQSDFKPVVSRLDMRRLDEATIRAGTKSIELMERAGQHIADFVRGHLDTLLPRARRGSGSPHVLVLAGPGNNGGDGYVVARMLAADGWQVSVAACGKAPNPSSDAGINCRRWRADGGTTIDVTRCQQQLQQDKGGWDLAVDALFGTGLDRPLDAPFVELISTLNASGTPLVAVDTPSGLCADSGRPLGIAVLADATVTLGAAKPGLFVGVGPNHTGHIAIADIGLVAPAEAGITPVGQVIDDETCAMWVPHRHATTHKGDLGHVLVVGGAPGKTGAVLLAARGALRAGAGLVTMAVPRRLAATIDAALPEAMTLALPESDSGEIGDSAWDDLSYDVSRYTTAAIGPGIGTGAGASALVGAMVERFAGTLVIDADGLNVLAAERDRLCERLRQRAERRFGAVVLTPHPGEMGRLTGTSSAEVQSNRLETVRAFSATHDAVLVLKGAATLVCDRQRTGFNSSGNPGMASPGMGDVLAGVTAALATRCADPFEAAALAVYVHGLAGDTLAARLRGPGFLAGEVADAVPIALAALSSGE